jgi:dTMP kinase
MYLTLEGPEATGKSTHAKILAQALKLRGYDVLLTKEPGSPHDPLCVKIRELLLNPGHIISDRSALFLFLADRAQHMETVADGLAKDKIVISDRSSLSTYVYHTARTRSFVSDEDNELCGLLDFAQQIQPEMCMVFNASLEWSLTQLQGRLKLDRIEMFDEAFHSRTHELFSEPQIKALCGKLSTSPKEIIYVPDTSGHTETEISSFIINQVINQIECE